MSGKKTLSPAPLVSIIIVNWNGGQVFKECLSSLSKIDYPNWELIIVDNGSADGSSEFPRDIIKKQKFEIIKNNKNLGFAPANNQGTEIAKGKYVLLLNNDTKVTPDFLSKLIERIEKDPLIGVIQPKILLMDEPGYLDNAGSFLTRIGFLHHWGFMKKDGKEFNEEKEIFSAKGACMLLRKSVINKTGLFDKDFFSYFEESDLCWRVWLAGYKVIFYPESVIYHKLGFTIRRLNVTQINYHYYKNRISSLVKNLGSENLLPVLFLHLLISLGIAFIFMLKIKFNSSYMILKAIGWNLANLSNTLNKRSKVQEMRILDDRALFQKLSVPINFRQYWNDLRRVEGDIKR